jgi:TetR/AcrR family transcriptional regulator
MAPKQQRDPEATRAALLEAAETIFLEKGFGNTSLSQIARQAGITKSLIHHYFGSKEGLWREVKTRRFMHYAQEQVNMIDEAQPTAELLKESIALYFNFLHRNPQIVKILAWMFLEQDQNECLDIDRELIRLGVEKVRAAQDEGALRTDIDARFILFVFIGLCEHWFHNKDHFVSSFSLDDISGNLDEAYLEAITKIFFEGILPAPSKSKTK